MPGLNLEKIHEKNIKKTKGSSEKKHSQTNATILDCDSPFKVHVHASDKNLTGKIAGTCELGTLHIIAKRK